MDLNFQSIIYDLQFFVQLVEVQELEQLLLEAKKHKNTAFKKLEVTY